MLQSYSFSRKPPNLSERNPQPSRMKTSFPLHLLLQNLTSSNFVTTQQRENEFSSAFAAPKFVHIKKNAYLCL
jgi:hypothetical protein